jgi:hypothetical protein
MAPYLIQYRAETDQTKALTSSMTANIPDSFGVNAAQSGSMTREIFLCWCHFFVKNLRVGLGGTKKTPKMLILDGRASRWSYQGLKHLSDNGVLVYCLPSHTSAHSQVIATHSFGIFIFNIIFFALIQPNDLGINRAFHKKMQEHVTTWHLENFCAKKEIFAGDLERHLRGCVDCSCH